MKKDLDKLLSRTLFTYFSILLVIVVLKLFGINYFGLDMDNKIINNINDFILKWKLENVWYAITLYMNTYIIFAITCNDNSKCMKIFTLITMPINMIIQIIKTKYNIPLIFMCTDILYLIMLIICYIKLIKKEKIYKYNIRNYFVFSIITIIFQFASVGIRSLSIQTQSLQENNFVVNIIINFDYFALMIFTYKLYFMKGGKDLWVMVHGSFLDLLISLKKLPTKLQLSYQLAKPKTQQDELANKIYLVLFWLYNFFSVFVILFIGSLNETFIECIFILSSFWINKGVFGKPFHLKKASTCFIVSSLSYYILNRLTWDIGISFLIPIILGITLSYITSKFMAIQENLYLHKGMSEENFYKLISKVTSNEEHIKICKMYYVDKETNLKIALRFNYSEINIKKIKQNINNKIKELYK